MQMVLNECSRCDPRGASKRVASERRMGNQGLQARLRFSFAILEVRAAHMVRTCAVVLCTTQTRSGRFANELMRKYFVRVGHYVVPCSVLSTIVFVKNA